MTPSPSRNSNRLPVDHILVQDCIAGRQELEIIRCMVPYSERFHSEDELKHRLGEIELETNRRRAVRVRSGKPLSAPVIETGPEFSRPVPRGGTLFIDAVLK